jgi:hypothetical protein
MDWNDTDRTFTKRADDGTLLEQRPYDADEHAAADARAAEAESTQNEQTLRQQAVGDVFDNLRTIAGGTGQFASAAIRDAAIRTCARGLVILIRLQLRRLDGTD